MMSVKCPGCGTSFRGKEEFAGKRVKCPKCGARFEHPSVQTRIERPPIEAQSDGLTVRLLDTQWHSRPGIILSQLKCYECGIGSEYVYCYTYPSQLELAELKKADRYRIKVGMAAGDPIGRIYGQVAVSKTSQSEPASVLLIFKILSARHLERWFHKRLHRAADATGSEWFQTNPEELVALYGEYVRTASQQPIEVTDAIAQSEPTGNRRKSIPRGSNNAHRQSYYGQGHRIDDLLESSTSPLSIKEIAQSLDLPIDRVELHIAYEISKNRSEIDSEGRVIFRNRRRTGQHRRDETGKSAKDRVLMLWVTAILADGPIDVEAWSEELGVKASTISNWISRWTNYKGSTFTGIEGFPRITHSMLSDVIAAIRKANAMRA